MAEIIEQEKGERNRLEWSFHPAGRRPYKTAAAVLSVLLFSWVAYALLGSPGWGLLAGLILLISLGRFFLPTSYALTPEGVSVKFIGASQARPWSAFQRAVKDRNGVFLSPFARPNRLENYRGLLLMCRENKDEVFEFAQKRIAENRKTEKEKA